MYEKTIQNEKVEEMKKTIIIRILVGVMAICISFLALTIAYFFNTDIETREPRQTIEEC